MLPNQRIEKIAQLLSQGLAYTVEIDGGTYVIAKESLCKTYRPVTPHNIDITSHKLHPDDIILWIPCPENEGGILSENWGFGKPLSGNVDTINDPPPFIRD